MPDTFEHLEQRILERLDKMIKEKESKKDSEQKHGNDFKIPPVSLF